MSKDRYSLFLYLGKGENLMDTPITRAEHEEFCRRMEAENKRLADEDKRQNRRIEKLEENVLQIGELTTSVEKLASSMESMLKEQEKQGKRLEELEGRDGQMWRKMMGYILSALIGGIVVFLLATIGLK